MRTAALHVAILLYLLAAFPRPALAQVDQERAQEFFKEAQALCERDGGRLWGVSICAPMVIGDARTQTFATSQPPPAAPRPGIIGLLNGPVQWGDTMWAAMSWETLANWPARARGEAFLHESFHIVQLSKGIAAPDRGRLGPNPRTENDHLDAVDGRYWLRLEWRALARALRESGELRAQAVREALAFRQARHTRYPEHVVSEYALDMNEGLASYTGIVLAAPSAADAIARGLELLAGAEDGESFVRTFAYTSGPAYGLLLDAASPGWPRRLRGGDDPAALLMRALAVQPAADVAAAALRYGGVELRAAEEQRDQQRQVRIAELRRRFIDGPVLVMPGGGSGLSDSRGAVVIPDVGTIYFHAYRMTGPWGALEADNGVLVSSDGRTRRLPSPVRRDETTISGDGWTLELAPGWVVREGARRGDFEVVRQSSVRSTLMKLNPYLAFDGQCREAFEFYEKTLGGRISFMQTIGESPMASSMPAEAHPRLMHVTLQIGDQVLQGADAPPGQFTKPAGFCVATHFDEVAEGERVFNALAQNGKIQMPFQATFWAKGFGMLIDQFGTPWIVNAGQVTGS